MASLARGLSHNRALVLLRLARSKIGDEGAVALSAGLGTNRGLNQGSPVALESTALTFSRPDPTQAGSKARSLLDLVPAERAERSFVRRHFEL